MPAPRFDRKSGPSPAYPDNGQHANVRLEKISVEQNTNETLEWLRPVNPEQMGTAAESRTEHISQREPELSAPVCTLWNVAQVALIRFLISVVSCCWKVIIWPKYCRAFSSCQYYDFLCHQSQCLFWCPSFGC